MAQVLPYRKAGAVITAACTCWFAGISMVGNVHAVKDAATRLDMLERDRRFWVLGQILAAAGTAAAPASDAHAGKDLAALSAAAMLAGSPLFVAALASRAADIRRFAYREGPGWPFLSYAGLQTAGVGAAGVALLLTPLKGPAAVASVASVPLFTAILARYRDIPPFVFYLLELAVGVKLMRYREAG